MPVDPVCFDYGVDMGMPVPGAPCNFNYKGASEYCVFPDFPLSKPAEGFLERFDHRGEIFLIPDGKSEVFQADSPAWFYLFDDPLEALPNTLSTSYRAYRAEPISAVNRHRKFSVALRTDQRNILML